MFIKERPLFDKKTYNWKKKQLSTKANFFFRYYDAYAACKIRIWYMVSLKKKKKKKIKK